MNNHEILKLLEDNLEGCKVSVTSEGNHFYITAIGDLFDGLGKVKRQQVVYRCLHNLLSDGTIHAVHMRLFTHQEHEQVLLQE